MDYKGFKIEICANSVESVKAAIAAGADRIELCGGMPEGGTTPSYGVIARVRELMPAGMHLIIRPRGGDFLYTEEESEVMMRDIEMARHLGVDGIVLGCLTPKGEVDVVLMRRLMALAGDMSVTFHRAFDMCRDPFQALETIEKLGCERILTSGQKNSALEGVRLLKELVDRAKEVIIMPGCGIHAANICDIAEKTGACEFHLSARTRVESDMLYRNPEVSMGGEVKVSEYIREVTSEEKVRQAIETLQSGCL